MRGVAIVAWGNGWGLRHAASAGVTAAAITVGALAFTAEGIPTADVELHDGGVWLTNQSVLMVGHLNHESQVLDAGLRTTSTTFDVYQEGYTVLVHDKGNNILTVVDPAAVAAAAEVALPRSSHVALGGGVVAISGGEDGSVWVMPSDWVASFDAEAVVPFATLGRETDVTVGPDGVAHAVSAETGAFLDIAIDDAGVPQIVGQGTYELGATDAVIVIAAGSTVAVWDADNTTLHVDGRTVEFPEGSVPQLSSDAHGGISVATPTGLAFVPSGGGDPVTTDAGDEGRPARPAYLNGCTYAAWAGSGVFMRDCDGDSFDGTQTIDGAGATAEFVFRINRDVVVLNDYVNGGGWLADAGLERVDNWKDLLPPPDDRQEDDSFDENEQLEQLPDRSGQNTAPVAEDDGFGARAGRTTILPVVDNDYDLDGDVLTAAVLDAKDVPGDVQLIRGGAALQVVLPDTASGTARFTYRVSDGRGGVDDADVVLTIVDEDSNSAPEPRRASRFALEQGASGSYNVLPDWLDPDGDLLILKSVTGDGTDTVDFSPNGVVTITANPDVQGVREFEVIVSDGTADATGTLLLLVKPTGTQAPLTNADQVVTVTDRPVVVSPLANDQSRTGNPLRLSLAKGEGGTVVTPDYTEGTFTFSASQPGTYYVLYRATDGPFQSENLVRIDVLAAVESSLPPIAVADVALVAPGADVLVDALANDSDPAGGVLVIQSIDVPADSGLTAVILEHRLVRVTNASGIESPVTLTYRVSNGALTSESEIVVIPVDPPASTVAPVAHDDEVVVRAGDIATVDVLANDEHPSGLSFTLAGIAEPGVDPSVAEVFVADGRIRVKAGATAGQATATYTIVDEFGQRDAAVITIKIQGADAPNSAPRPVDVTARALGGSAVRIPIPLDGIDPDGDSVELVGTDGAPELGRITQVGQDWFVYEAYADSQGTDNFTYVVRDRLGAEATGTVVVGVAPPAYVNTAPVAVRDQASVLPGRAISVPVLVNDSDPDSDLFGLEPDGLTVGAGITATVVADRILVEADEEGQYTIGYTISDVYGATATSYLLVTVDEDTPKLPPLARDDRVPAADVARDGTVVVPVLENDEDPDGVATRLEVAVDPLDGSVGTDGAVTLTALASARIVTYTVTDIDGLTAKAFILVPGIGVNPPSLISDAPIEVTSGVTETINLADYVTTASGNPAIITEAERVFAGHASGAELVVDEDTLSYTSAEGYVGKDAITFQVTDGTSVDDPLGRTATLTLGIVVRPAGNVDPTFRNASVEAVAGGAGAEVDLAKLTADGNPADAATTTWRVAGSLPTGLRASIAEGVMTVTAGQDMEPGVEHELPITVDDGHGGSAQGVILVTVLPGRGDAEDPANPVPAALPVANDDVVTDATAGEAVQVPVLRNDVNPYTDGSPLDIVEARLQSGDATVTIDGGEVVVTPGASFAGTVIVRYMIGDASGIESRRSTARVLVTVFKAPDAPSKPVAKVVEDSRVVLEWVEPSNNGAPITGYKVTSDQGTTTMCPTSICAIEGLTNDLEYRFTVTAMNAAGESAPSPASDPARPDIHPDQPSAPVLTFGDQALDITWVAPTTKGSPIRSYTLEISPAPVGGSQKANLTGTSYRWEGLENGVAYQVRIQAYNDAVDPSSWSEYSVSEVPAGPPFQVAKPTTTRLTPVGSRAQIAVQWVVPDGNGDNVSSFTVNAIRSGTTVASQTVSGSTTSAPFELDPSASDYTFTVVAHNKAGASTPSTPSDPRRAFVAPGAPTGVTGTAEDRATTVSFTPGAANGADAAWISYQYELNGNGAWVALPANGRITGLQNGTSYTVRIRATTTADGATYTGTASSASAAVVPFGPIGNPSISSARGSGLVAFTVTAPATNGRPITAIEYRSREGSGSWSGWQSAGFTSGSKLINVGTSSPGNTAYIEVRVTAQDTPTQSSASASNRSKDRRSWISKGSVPGACSSCRYLVVNWEEFQTGTYTVRCGTNHGSGGYFSPYSYTVTASGSSGSKQLACYFGYPGYTAYVDFVAGPGTPFSSEALTW